GRPALHDRGRLAQGPVPDRDRIPGVQQVPGHGTSHDPQADKADALCHPPITSLGIGSGFTRPQVPFAECAAAIGVSSTRGVAEEEFLPGPYTIGDYAALRFSPPARSFVHGRGQEHRLTRDRRPLTTPEGNAIVGTTKASTGTVRRRPCVQ